MSSKANRKMRIVIVMNHKIKIKKKIKKKKKLNLFRHLQINFNKLLSKMIKNMHN